ncbi:probable flavin-containing monooxygenase 1 [Rutidosis leptorrhynchoides]|uniref:probable flavin-containing monooxygenase 1 n=1 Tax=Rutidosis leptorrhynchoides TaxID=125765 RepID=UPI003A997A02
MATEKKVGIIGAGISGILACKNVLAKGFVPIVFESRSKLGGVLTETIKSTWLQSPKTLYEFSYFRLPDSVKIEHILLIIKFSNYEGPSDEEMQVWSLWGGNGEPFSGKGKWTIKVQDIKAPSTHDNEMQTYEVDFLIPCTGISSDVPNIPEFLADQSTSIFQGKVLHSKDYYAMDHETAAKFIKGKRIVVVVPEIRN